MVAAKTKNLGAFPRGFVTVEDLEKAVAIQEQLKLLDNHRNQLNSQTIGEDVRQAEKKYQSDPTEENLLAVLQKGIHYHAIADGGGSPPLVKFRSNIVNMMRELFKRRFSPLAKAILERGLIEARNTLKQVSDDEEIRCRSMTGSGGPQAGPIIAAASKPVQALERRLADIDTCNSGFIFHVESFISFLRERLAESDSELKQMQISFLGTSLWYCGRSAVRFSRATTGTNACCAGF